MDVSGIGNSLNSAGTQYDFTKMTNQQFLTAVQDLGSEGKISQSDAAQLSFIAQGVDSVPINGPSPSVQSILADPTQHNFISELQGDDYGANTPGAVGGAMYNSMLNDLKAYQGTAVDPTSTLSTMG